MSATEEIRRIIVLWLLDMSLKICPKPTESYSHLLRLVDNYAKKESEKL